MKPLPFNKRGYIVRDPINLAVGAFRFFIDHSNIVRVFSRSFLKETDHRL